MSEIAVVSSRKARLQGLAEEGNTRAAAALKLAEDPNRFLATVQIGITLVGIFAGAYGGATFAGPLAEVLRGVPSLAPYSRPFAFALVVVLITYLSLVVGELVPKRVALTNPEGVAMSVAGSMSALSRVTAPFVRLLSLSTEGALRLLRVKASGEPSVSEEEVTVLIQQGAQAGVFEQEERAIVENLFWLGDRRVSTIMTPRREIAWVDLSSDAGALRAHLEKYPYSRFVVCRETLDQVEGIVDTRDLLHHCLSGAPLDFKATLTKPLFVPESLPVLKLLEQFKKTGVHLALVVDEYGGIEGVVTLNDVLEGLVGDLPELGEEVQAVRAVQREDGSWLLDGLLEVDELEDRLGLDIAPEEEGDDYRTLGGFVVARLGRIPAPADAFEHAGWRFEVMDMDGSRVDKILAAPQAPETESASPEGEGASSSS